MLAECLLFLWSILGTEAYLIPMCRATSDALQTIISVAKGLCSMPYECSFFFDPVKPVEPTYWEIFVAWITWSDYPYQQYVNEGICWFNGLILVSVAVLFILYFLLSKKYFSLHAEKPSMVPFMLNEDEDEFEEYIGYQKPRNDYAKCPCNLYVDERGDKH